VVFLLLSWVGLGAVVYTLILAVRARRSVAPRTESPGAASSGAAEAGAAEAGAGAPGVAAPPPGPVPPISAGMPHAGFWIRMAALLIDLMLVGIVMAILHAHMQLVALAAYGAIMWKLRGTTVGGILFDLRVVRLDGLELDWGTAIVRALGCFLSLAVVGLGFLWIAFDPVRQAWHDKIAGTVVVRVPRQSVPG
jgi:uncharacterized RDD family membrane protein YckC